MNLQQQQHFVDNFCEKMKSTILGKGNDYANADRLSNFKLAGAICGLTPEQNCLSMIATKVARLGVLLGGKTPNNESIEDSLLDLANYAVLLGCIRDEQGKGISLWGGPPSEGITSSETTFLGVKTIPNENPPVPNFGVQDSNTFAGSTIEGYEDELVKIGNDGR